MGFGTLYSSTLVVALATKLYRIDAHLDAVFNAVSNE